MKLRCFVLLLVVAIAIATLSSAAQETRLQAVHL